MATTVNVTQSQGNAYTWNTANYTWDSPEGGKTWDGSFTNAYTLSVTETVAISEFNKKTFLKFNNDSLCIRDRGFNQLTKKILENLQLSEGYIDYISFMLRIYEAITFVELNPKTITLPKKEVLSIIELGRRNSTINKKEAVNISEIAAKAIIMPKIEALQINELASREVLILKNENFTIDETKQYKSITKVNKENINVAEMYTDFINFMLRIMEQICFDEVLLKNVNHPIKENFQIADKVLKTPIKKIIEALNIAETKKNTIQFQRVIKEVLGIADKMAKNMKMTRKEVLQMTEAYLRNANAVLSDIYFSQNDLTLDDFKSIGTPMGYKDFKDFIPGDLEYQYALIRMIIEAGVTTARPQVSDWNLNIDVPDTRERGTVDVPATNFRIDFKRRFFDSPDVRVIARAGQVFDPFITSTDDTGFNIELRDKTTNNVVAGTITWSADGF